MEREIKPIWLMQPVRYMGEKLERGKWIYECKYDGWRVQIIRSNNKVKIFGRRLNKNPNWTRKFPKDLLEQIYYSIPDGTLLDGELCTNIGRNGIPSFLAGDRDIKPIIYVFDIVYREYEFLGEYSWMARRAILVDTVAFDDLLVPSEFENRGNISELFRHMVKHPNVEGLVIKRVDSKYEVGVNGPIVTASWRKVKEIGGINHES